MSVWKRTIVRAALRTRWAVRDWWWRYVRRQAKPTANGARLFLGGQVAPFDEAGDNVFVLLPDGSREELIVTAWGE